MYADNMLLHVRGSFVALAQSLVGLNFNQEAVEADMRYGLVRVRENAESIAFYGGQANEMMALKEVRQQ